MFLCILIEDRGEDETEGRSSTAAMGVCLRMRCSVSTLRAHRLLPIISTDGDKGSVGGLGMEEHEVRQRRRHWSLDDIPPSPSRF